MRINRVVANVETSDVDRTDAFYHGVLGLERIMDHHLDTNVRLKLKDDR